MSDPLDINVRVKDAWRAVFAAERARGRVLVAALVAVGNADAPDLQERYEAALALFRSAQLEAFNVTLGLIPLMQQDITDLVGRVQVLEEQAAGEADRIRRLGERADIADRLIFSDPSADPLDPYDSRAS